MNSEVRKLKFGNFKFEYLDDVLYGIYKTDVKESNDKSSFVDLVVNELNEYFLGKRKSFSFKYKLIGTDFQLKVWHQLELIPYGSVKTYKDIAKLIGNEKSCRAVGNANNKNPLMIIVPCHRIVGSNNNLVGYAGGLEMKKDLLSIEGYDGFKR